MRTAFIGDVHGCIDELRYVAQRAIAEVDHVVFLGDYIDRGPDSKAVIDTLVTLQIDYPERTTFLRGNHDTELLKVLEGDVGGEKFLRMGGAKTIRSYIDSPYTNALSRLRSTVPQAHRAFLESLQHSYVGKDVVAVHDPSDAPQGSRYVVAGHASQPGLVPLVGTSLALIDTGCGTLKGGRLTCFVWPTREWWQSPSI
jgi:serine/threonine protein phosphatase 1